jgi:arylformamidase
MVRHEADWPRARIDADYTAKDCIDAQGFDTVIAAYARQSIPAADLPGARLNLCYDPASGQVMDLYGAGGGCPVVMFIHGGYWRALSKDHSAFMAPMLAARGIATAVPDYTLAPAASLTEITRQMRAAFAYLWHNADTLGIDRTRIVVAGSSAGGHLAAVLASDGWQADHDLPPGALRGAMPISGVFELAPIAASHVQDWMSLTADEVATLSPLRHPTSTKLVVAVAQDEVPGFHRQSHAYANALGLSVLMVPGRNHFDVILDLMDDNTTLSQALIALT